MIINQLSNKAKLFLADDTTVIIELHPYEINLLNAMRNKFKFGKLEVLVRDGLPMRIERAVESIDLTRRVES